MDRQTKVLILHASVGFGHTKAAKAIEEAFKNDGTFKNVSCVDTISLGTAFFRTMYDKSYTLQVQYAPWLWGAFYHSFNLPWVYGVMRFIRHAVNRFGGQGLQKFLVQEQPDIILTTHFFSVEVAAYLRKHGKIKSKIVSVITDFLPHFVWIAPEVDAYITGSEESKRELVAMGVDPAKVHVTGIPILKKFSEKKDRTMILNKLGLEPSLFTVLATSGGAGLSSTRKIVEGVEALGDAQLIVVCGKNADLAKALEEKFASNKKIKILGYVDNMDELMEAADVVIGKGGGLTISEAMAKQKPMILFRSVPGQETRNDYLLGLYKAGFATSSPEKLVGKIRELRVSSDALALMKQGAAKLSKPQAAQSVLDLVKNEL